MVGSNNSFGLFGAQSVGPRLIQAAVIGVAFLLGSTPTAGRLAIGALSVAVAVGVLHVRSRPRQSLPARSDDVSFVASAITAGVVVLGLLAGISDVPLGARELLLRWLLGFGGLLVSRALVRQLFDRNESQRVIVVGTGEDALEVVNLVRDHRETNFDLVGVVGDQQFAGQNNLDSVWLGDVEELAAVISEHNIGGVIVTTNGFRSAQFRHILTTLRQLGVEPMLSTGVGHIDTASLRLGSVVHEPFVSIDWTRSTTLSRRSKRALDICGASVGLLLGLPLMIAATLLIKLEDRGPVLYRSARIGKEHQPFDMLKFRSMRINAHDEKNDLAQRNERSGPLFKISHDPRVTRIGRILRETSIDELPQLLNVLRGQMSLVGPRPALPEEADAFDAEHHARFDALPGVTGLWQVEARSNPNFSAYRRLDLHYIANQSVRMDVEIIIATAVQILVGALLLPMNKLRAKPSLDGIEASTSEVIDLRERRAVVETTRADSRASGF